MLEELRAEVEQIREGDIAKPVREIAPISLRIQQLAMQCTQQFHELSVSQYAFMKDGRENLARLAGACSQVSLAATLCNLAIHQPHRDPAVRGRGPDPRHQPRPTPPR